MSPSFETSKSFTKSSRFTTKAMDTNYNKNNDDSNETSQPLTDSQLYQLVLFDGLTINPTNTNAIKNNKIDFSSINRPKKTQTRHLTGLVDKTNLNFVKDKKI